MGVDKSLDLRREVERLRPENARLALLLTCAAGRRRAGRSGGRRRVDRTFLRVDEVRRGGDKATYRPSALIAAPDT
ncbi:MAG TPA: hypothetical protein VFT95_17230 [Micromonosporaceae bacterium]|nr:hypothetical protein [Micromonosporaceae bacterium]